MNSMFLIKCYYNKSHIFLIKYKYLHTYIQNMPEIGYIYNETEKKRK